MMYSTGQLMREINRNDQMFNCSAITHNRPRLLVTAAHLVNKQTALCCSEQTAAVNKQLQRTNSCCEQTIARNKQLQWTNNCKKQTTAMNKQLQWTNNCKKQTAAMNKQLQWTNSCSEQTIAMNKQLQRANSYNEQTAAMSKQLQWANSCTEQRTTVNGCSCLFTAVGWTGSNSWQAVQGCTTWICRMCICGLVTTSRYCKCKWGAVTMYNFLYTD